MPSLLLFSSKITFLYSSVIDTTSRIIELWFGASKALLDNHFTDPVSVLKIKLSDLGYIYTLSYDLWFVSKSF
jgi:hypothetical protein